MKKENIYSNVSYAGNTNEANEELHEYEDVQNLENAYQREKSNLGLSQKETNDDKRKDIYIKSESCSWKKIILVNVIISILIALIQVSVAAFVLKFMLSDEILVKVLGVSQRHETLENSTKALETVMKKMGEKIKETEEIVMNSTKLLMSPTTVDACNEPPFIPFAYYPYTDLTVGSVVHYTCSFGFKLVGKPEITCLEKGRWSNINISCLSTSFSDVRLKGSLRKNEGRVEIYHNSAWGTVCDDYWDNVDAGVVCRQLGYKSGIARLQAYFGLGNGTIWMDDVHCDGSESSLRKCIFDQGWGGNDCQHSEDAGVICY